MKTTSSIAVAAVLLAGPAALLSAQQEQPHNQETGSQGAHFHPNHVAAFVGATSELRGSKKTHFTLGADYVRRFGSSGQFGVGGFAEVIFHDPTEWLFGAAGYFYPTRALWVQAAGGVELYQGGHGGDEPTETTASFLLRFGAGYQFELPGFSLTPLVLLDLVRETEALVWGVSIGKGF